MNKYLEKIASWKDPTKFFGYVTGKAARDAGVKVRNMEEVIANKLSLGDLKKGHEYARGETLKARVAASSTAAAGGIGAAYGYKKHRNKQREETLSQYKTLLKQGGVASSAKDLGYHATTAVGRILHRVGSRTADMMNTAGGGKIKDYALRQGFKLGTKEYDTFSKGNPRHQVRALLKKHNVTKKNTGPKTRKEFIHNTTQEVGNLHKHRRDAKIGLYSAGAAGVSAYGWKKARDASKKDNKYY